MNKRKHDWKHFSRRTLSLILVLVTLVALCIPTGMALEDNSADVETQPAAVQTAETETGADTGAAATSETDAQPVAETEPTAEVGQEPVTEPEAEQVSEPETTAPTPAETQTAQPTGSEPVSEPETTEPEQTTVPTVAASNVQTVGEPETTENITTIDLGSNEADALLLPDDDNALAVSAALTTIDVTITDDIKASGVLKVTVPTDVALGTDVTYKWYKSDSQNGTYTEVTRKKVTGSSYNVTEYGDQVNVVLDGGAQMWYKVEAINADGQVIATSSAYQVNYYKDVQNGSFENPTPSYTWAQFTNGTSKLDWRTTGNDGAIEVVKRTTSWPSTWSTVQQYYGLEGNLPDGTQYAELNCEAYGTLYQDVLTTPKATLNWQLYHSARLKSYWQGPAYYNGTDVMYVMIMSTVKAEELNIKSTEDVKAIVNAVNNHETTYDNVDLTGVSVNYVADGGTWSADHKKVSRYYQTSPNGEKISTSNEWTKWTGDYKVPAGQYMTRFFFVSYESASGNQTVGNMLDDVKFTTDPLPPDPNRGNLTVTKTVVGFEDSLPSNYTVTVSATGLQDYTFNADDFMRQVDGTWTASYSYQNIPAGSYTVTESAPEVEGYKWTASASKQDVAVTDQKTETATFTNSYEQLTGTLTVTKNITGELTDAERNELQSKLTFNIVNADGTTVKTINGNTMTWSNGSASETVTVPAGTYTVTEDEADVTNYTCNTTYSDPAAVTGGGSASLRVNNNYTRKLGDLTITKTITGLRENDRNALMNKLTFTVTADGETEQVINANIMTWDAVNNQLTYKLENLKVGKTYTVTENNAEMTYYTLTTNGDKGMATITEDGTANVSITNAYTENMVNLTISKTVKGSNKNPGSFTFLATNDRTGITYTATIVTDKKGTATITSIPAGKYTVTELDNDNYNHVGEKTKTVTITEGTGTVSFENKGTGDSYQYSSSAVNKGAVNKDGKIIFTKPEKINHITKTN